MELIGRIGGDQGVDATAVPGHEHHAGAGVHGRIGTQQEGGDHVAGEARLRPGLPARGEQLHLDRAAARRVQRCGGEAALLRGEVEVEQGAEPAALLLRLEGQGAGSVRGRTLGSHRTSSICEG